MAGKLQVKRVEMGIWKNKSCAVFYLCSQLIHVMMDEDDGRFGVFVLGFVVCFGCFFWIHYLPILDDTAVFFGDIFLEVSK